MMGNFNTEKAVYSPNDFILWQENGMLELTPKFQRRPVWRTPAKSFFIDTILRGMTVPPLYLRMTQNAGKTKAIREVVDGQQRVRSVLDFVAGSYRLSKTLTAEWAGKKYDQLEESQRNHILEFSFSAEVFKGISDREVLEVFCRLNMNGVPLNKQELRNGKYFGIFKQLSSDLALEYLEFWREHSIFSEQNIARMVEVELTSELLIAGNSGMQDKKSSIDSFYEKYEDVYAEKDRDERRFREVIEVISDTFVNTLPETEFRRPPMFYTLYCVVYHFMYGLPNIDTITPRKRLGKDQMESLREAVSRLSDVIVRAKGVDSKIPNKYVKFVAACQRQTDNITPRTMRFKVLFEEAF